MSLASGKLSLVERTIGVLCLVCLSVVVAGYGPRVNLNALSHNNPGIVIMVLLSFWIAHV